MRAVPFGGWDLKIKMMMTGAPCIERSVAMGATHWSIKIAVDRERLATASTHQGVLLKGAWAPACHGMIAQRFVAGVASEPPPTAAKAYGKYVGVAVPVFTASFVVDGYAFDDGRFLDLPSHE